MLTQQKEQTDENNQPQGTAMKQIIQVSLLASKQTKYALAQINLGEALTDYQQSLPKQSVRDWANYVKGFSFCLSKQYGILKADLLQLHQSMMKKEIFYGYQHEEQVQQARKSPIRRKQTKKQEIQILYSARDPIEVLQEQSESSVSNPRNIASIDQLRLQEDQKIQFQHIDMGDDSLGKNSNPRMIDEKTLQEQVIREMKAVEQTTLQEILKNRKQRSQTVSSGIETPDQTLVPRILINNEEVFSQADQFEYQQDLALSEQQSNDSRQRRIAVMSQFNKLDQFQPSQEQKQEVLKPRKEYTTKVVIDDVRLAPQDEQLYQSNLEVLYQAQEKIEELNNRMGILSFQNDFWREKDTGLIEDMQKLKSNVDTELTKLRSHGKKDYHDLFTSEQQTEQLLQMKVQFDNKEDIKPFDFEDLQEIPDYEQFSKQEENEYLKLDVLQMKEESKIYHRIIFDLKKESDENEMNFDEYYQIRNKQTQLSRGKAFYDLLVMARLGQVQLEDHKPDDLNFSILGIKIK